MGSDVIGGERGSVDKRERERSGVEKREREESGSKRTHG
jgi:hypothetical protein